VGQTGGVATDTRKSPLSGCLTLALWLGAAALAPASSVSTNELLSQIVMVRVGGIKVPGPWTTNNSRAMSLHLSKPNRLEISFGPVDAAAHQPLRLLRKLEGLDDDWQEAGGQMQRAEMQLMVMIHDAANHLLSYRRFTMRGESAGWRGEPGKSGFSPRHESIVLPTGAERLQVLFTAENWTVLGSAAITDFRVLRLNDEGQEENLWPDPHLSEGENLEHPQGRPRYWQRGIIGARMAQVLPLPAPATGRALAIQDDDVHISATWQADLLLRNRAQAGDELSLKWREAFSVGIGERSRATFDPLPPGRYVFRVKTVTPFGTPIGNELTLAISVAQLFWKRPAVLAVVFVLFAAGLAAVVRSIIHRRWRARLERVERQRVLERERARIAQDIHDDLGASLTRINLLSQSALGKMETEHTARHETEHIRTVAVELTQALDEVVWAVSPRHDSLESLLSYLTNFAEELLGPAGLRARIHVPQQLPASSLPSDVRHNVFLAVKEILNNVIKHACASEVHVRLELQTGAFRLTIEDNGCGFDPGTSDPLNRERTTRHGLVGIQERIRSIHGQLAIESAPGRGTRLIITVPLKGVAI
jgi:signal transduction histidine kinase